jgi:hypothetical protein
MIDASESTACNEEMQNRRTVRKINKRTGEGENFRFGSPLLMLIFLFSLLLFQSLQAVWPAQE